MATKTLKVIKKTGINQYLMDDNKCYVVSVLNGGCEQAIRLRVNGEKKSIKVIEFKHNYYWNLTSVTIEA